MALIGAISIVNCCKEHTATLVVDGSYSSIKMQRGDPAGTGNFVCEDLPQKNGQEMNDAWKLPYIKLNIKVEKKAEEVKDLHDGIIVECQEFDCPFNKGKER